MPAYVIARMKVNDPDGYRRYAEQTPDVVARYGGRFLVRGGRMTLREGDNSQLDRTVVVRFDSFEQAQVFYDSPEYQEIATLRWQAAESELLIVEGTGD
ncbi:MAG TPA: DUF1330 domain-containing protein [Gammaproteobacteria bacterium]|nr:DUF1330 domain-containing protein [Gammaproteobacteria bacterium]